MMRVEHQRILDLRSNLGALQELVYLLVRHLLSQLGEHVTQFTRTNEAVSLLVKYLETSNELLCGSRSIR